MRVPLFQIDAFTGELFSGNPAAVCPLEEWLEDEKLQAMAAENNLSVTAFFVGEEGRHELRWFTPTTEVDLCGHATLASAFVIWNHLGDSSVQLSFQTRGGLLLAERQDDLVSMSFPSQVPQPCQSPSQLAKALGRVPGEVWFAGESARSGNYLAVYGTEEEVRSLKPDLQLLGQFEGVGFITTAPGESADFVSRYFAPAFGVPEDPVTGSTHCTLIPYWANRIGKTRLYALQVSVRGGELFCQHRKDKVVIAGRAVCYFAGAAYL